MTDKNIIKREYLKYADKGTEPKAIAVINRDYNMYRFWKVIKEYEKKMYNLQPQ